MQTNLFGPFLMIHLLLDLLKIPGNARIIFVSSLAVLINNLTLKNLNATEDKTMPFLRYLQIYGNSKAGQMIISNEFAEKLKPFGITSNVVHPGLVKTEIFNRAAELNLLSTISFVAFYIQIFLFGKTPEEGAQRSLTAATSDCFKNVTGSFLWHVKITPKCARDKEFRKKVWKQIEDYVKLRKEEKI